MDRTKSAGLREMLIRSFVAGLFARHLAQRQRMGNAEEAFICSMLQSLGETLTMFYFQEEHEDVEARTRSDGLDRREATRRVLGIDFATLGAAVAREWRFPDVIVTAIAGMPPDCKVEVPRDDAQRLRDVSVFADRLCEALGRGARGVDDIEKLGVRFSPSIDLPPETVLHLADAALAKLDEYSGILGVDTRRSTWYQPARVCTSEAAAPAAQDTEAIDRTTPAGRVTA